MKVFVYYNLHKKLWSIKALEGPQKGRVIAHRHYLWLANPRPKVSQKGRERVLREGRKNVHAGIVGEYYATKEQPMLTNGQEVSYNPYYSGTFYYREDGYPEWTGLYAEYATFFNRNVRVY